MYHYNPDGYFKESLISQPGDPCLYPSTHPMAKKRRCKGLEKKGSFQSHNSEANSNRAVCSGSGIIYRSVRSGTPGEEYLGGQGRQVWGWITWSLRSFQQFTEIPRVQTFPSTLQGALLLLHLKLCPNLCRKRLDSSQMIMQVILMLMHYTNPVTLTHFALPLTQKLTRKATAEQCRCLILHDIGGRSFYRGQMTPVVKMAAPRLFKCCNKGSVYHQFCTHTSLPSDFAPKRILLTPLTPY